MKKYFCLTYVILFLLIVSQSAPAGTINLTLTWDRNPERYIRYRVYHRQPSSVNYTRLKTVRDPTATVAVSDNSVSYFVVTAINAAGLESPFSKRTRWP